MLVRCYVAGCRPSFWQRSDHHVTADYVGLRSNILANACRGSLGNKSTDGNRLVDYCDKPEHCAVTPRNNGDIRDTGVTRIARFCCKRAAGPLLLLVCHRKPTWQHKARWIRQDSNIAPYTWQDPSVRASWF